MYSFNELTLIIELIVLERSNKKTAKIVILRVHAGLYVHFGIHWACKKSPHILHYMRFTRLLATSSLFLSRSLHV